MTEANNRALLARLISSDTVFMNEPEEMITSYMHTLPEDKPLHADSVRQGYTAFKVRTTHSIETIATKHGLPTIELQQFIEAVLCRGRLDGEQLSELMSHTHIRRERSWQKRMKAEQALMAEAVPLIQNLANGRHILDLSDYAPE